MWQWQGILFSHSVFCSTEKSVLDATQHPFGMASWNLVLILAGLNQTHEMRAALKRGVETQDGGGSEGALWGFNQVALHFILGPLWRSELDSWEYHRGMAPKLSSLRTFLKPSEEGHLCHLKWLCHHLYFCSNSGFNGFSELLALKPYRKYNLNWAPSLLGRSNVISPWGQL